MEAGFVGVTYVKVITNNIYLKNAILELKEDLKDIMNG